MRSRPVFLLSLRKAIRAGAPALEFNGFVESVAYGPASTDASIASALAGTFTRDFHASGLYAKAGANANADPTVVTFQLVDGSQFTALTVVASSPFTLAGSNFGAPPPLVNSGT